MKMSKSLIGWQLHMQSGRYSTVTIDGYIGAINRVIEFLNDPEVSDIALWDLEGFMIDLRNKGVSESTRQYYWKVIRSYFSWASMKKGLNISRPDEELEMPTVPEPEVLPYTEQEIRKLLKACEMSNESVDGWKFKRPTAVRDKLLILVLLDTGVRVSELCRIKIGDINLETQSIHIKAFESGLKSKDRVVYVGNKTMSYLWRIVADDADPDDYHDLDFLRDHMGPASACSR